MSTPELDVEEDCEDETVCVENACESDRPPVVIGSGHTARVIKSHYTCEHAASARRSEVRGSHDWPTLLMDNPDIGAHLLVKPPSEYVEPTRVFRSKLLQLNFTEGSWAKHAESRSGASSLSASIGPADFIRLFNGSGKNAPRRVRFVPVAIDVVSYNNPLMIPLMMRFSDNVRNWLAGGTPVGGPTTIRDPANSGVSMTGYPLMPVFSGYVERDAQNAFLIDQGVLDNPEIATLSTVTRSDMANAVANSGGGVQGYATLPAPVMSGKAFPKPESHVMHALQQAAYLAMHNYGTLSADGNKEVLQTHAETQEVALKVDKAKMIEIIKASVSMEEHSFIVGGHDSQQPVLTATIHPSDSRGWDTVAATAKAHKSTHASAFGVDSVITVQVRVSGLFIPLPLPNY